MEKSINFFNHGFFLEVYTKNIFLRLNDSTKTNAIFAWLDDETKPHPNRLEVSFAESNTVLGLFKSGLEHVPVALPFVPAESLLEALKAKL